GTGPPAKPAGPSAPGLASGPVRGVQGGAGRQIEGAPIDRLESGAGPRRLFLIGRSLGRVDSLPGEARDHVLEPVDRERLIDEQEVLVERVLEMAPRGS